MKKLLTVVFAMLLAGSLALAQVGGGTEGKKEPETTKNAASGKKATKTKKGHKGGKKGNKELNPQRLPPKPPPPNATAPK